MKCQLQSATTSAYPAAAAAAPRPPPPPPPHPPTHPPTHPHTHTTTPPTLQVPTAGCPATLLPFAPRPSASSPTPTATARATAGSNSPRRRWGGGGGGAAGARGEQGERGKERRRRLVCAAHCGHACLTPPPPPPCPTPASAGQPRGQHAGPAQQGHAAAPPGGAGRGAVALGRAAAAGRAARQRLLEPAARVVRCGGACSTHRLRAATTCTKFPAAATLKLVIQLTRAEGGEGTGPVPQRAVQGRRKSKGGAAVKGEA